MPGRYFKAISLRYWTLLSQVFLRRIDAIDLSTYFSVLSCLCSTDHLYPSSPHSSMTPRGDEWTFNEKTCYLEPKWTETSVAAAFC